MARLSFPAPALDEFSGRALGKYEIACRLSAGGMSEIFLAFQRGAAGFRKYVVLKRILNDVKGREEVVRMFVQEAKLAAGFAHSNIAQVFDLDVADGDLFLAMEFVPGATLVEVAKACLSAGASIPTGFSLSVARDTALALHYAHTFTDAAGRHQPVLHRDVAEKNIMVSFEGTIKLLDFGIAKRLDRAGHTHVGTVKGTSGYMSPEQIRGEKLDARSDIFSLGVVLHECLCGQRLFYRKTREEELDAALNLDAPLPSRRNREVNPELDAVVQKALSRERDRRFHNAREMAKAIERAAGPLLWEQEKIAGFIQQLFAERREQTRKLLGGLLDDGEVSGVHLARHLAVPELDDSLPTKTVAVPEARETLREEDPPFSRAAADVLASTDDVQRTPKGPHLTITEESLPVPPKRRRGATTWRKLAKDWRPLLRQLADRAHTPAGLAVIAVGSALLVLLIAYLVLF
ncbi:MAG: protein kinase [Myxococcales bacterium]|nr:protein kinase [Myxococcales bacterium]